MSASMSLACPGPTEAGMEIGFYFEEYTDVWSFVTDSVTITDAIRAFEDLRGPDRGDAAPSSLRRVP